MVAIFGLGITGIAIANPKIKLSKTKKGIEVNQRRNNLLVDSNLGITIPRPHHLPNNITRENIK